MTHIAVIINGRAVEADLEPRISLGEFLREHERLTGTHLACEHGVCGACTVLLNGMPVRSCITYAVACDGMEVRTIEGFDADPLMGELRQAFSQEHALQCGFCTPGMLITARDILRRRASADEQRIRAELAGNLCRCTGYVGIVKAIQCVMRELPSEARLLTPAPPTAAAGAVSAFSTFAATPQRAEDYAPSRKSAASAETPEEGWSRIADRFVVTRPVAQVWQAFADTPRMARCLPGVELSGDDATQLKARIRIAFGPIKADFTGVASVRRDDINRVGVLEGTGTDARGGSRAKGRVAYRLSEEAGDEATGVDIVLDYQLQGPLAQFARSGLVQDFSRRLVAEFASNLAADLSGGLPAHVPSRSALNAGSLFLSAVWARIKHWIGI